MAPYLRGLPWSHTGPEASHAPSRSDQLSAVSMASGFPPSEQMVDASSKITEPSQRGVLVRPIRLPCESRNSTLPR